MAAHSNRRDRVRRKSGYCSNGFAFLTAAGDEWLPADALGIQSFRAASIATVPVRGIHPSLKKVYDCARADAVTGVMHRCDR